MSKRLLLLLSVVTLGACADDPLVPPREQPAPAFSHGSAHAFSGRMLGPDGASLCSSLPEAATWRLTFAETVSGTFHGNLFGTCPNDAFHVDLPGGGSYLARIVLPLSPDIGTLPPLSVMREPVVLDTDVTRDIQVLEGATLGGGITVEGQSVDGVLLNLQFSDLPPNFFGPQALSSGRQGPWLAPFAPVPLYLQTGVPYRVSAIRLLGVVGLGPDASTEFVFPDDADDVTLRFATSRAARIMSHDATRMTVTSMPGSFGGARHAAKPPLGRGWGVQFPDPAAHTGWSQLFEGGLMLGVNGTVLTGVDIGGFGGCPPGGCHDLGLDATGHPQPADGEGRVIEWRYSDDGSSEAVGLEVVQQSYDGTGGDYVLFRFSVTNASGASISLTPGLFMDWDLDGAPGDDVGDSPAEFGGRLMLQTNVWGGNVFGTLLAGIGAANNYFLSNSGGGFPLADQVAALDGALTNTATGHAADWWYAHAGAAVTLGPGESTEFWVALVAGETRADALANAAAADSEIVAQRD